MLIDSIEFNFGKEKKVGHMRCDFSNNRLANQWFAGDLGGSPEINFKEINQVVNDIMKQEFPTYDSVVETCDGEGYSYECNRFAIEGNYVYWIRLVPVQGDYNYYIHVYKGN